MAIDWTKVWNNSFIANLTPALKIAEKKPELLAGLGAALTPQNLSLFTGTTAPPVPILKDIAFEEYTPEQLQYLGDLELQNLSDSELRKILTDPRLQEIQYGTLDQLGEISQKGMTDIDRARLNEIQAEQQAVDRGQREATLQSMKQRGMSGTGNELAYLLHGQQASSNQANRNALDVNAEAQARALNALINRGQFAGGMQQQQFEQEAEKAQAQDIINRFNIQSQNAARERNLQLRQEIANQNRMNLQDIRNANVDQRNRAMTYNVVDKPATLFGMQSGNAQLAAQGIQNAANLKAQKDAQWQNYNLGQQQALLNAAGTVGMGVALKK